MCIYIYSICTSVENQMADMSIYLYSIPLVHVSIFMPRPFIPTCIHTYTHIHIYFKYIHIHTQ